MLRYQEIVKSALIMSAIQMGISSNQRQYCSTSQQANLASVWTLFSN